MATLDELAPHGRLTEPTVEAAEARWELAELASRCTGDAHGLDDGQLTGALVLRAAAVALDEPVPNLRRGPAGTVGALGVTPDLVSGTVIVWRLRPTGSGPWATMMRDRADLQLVTHLTLYELRGAAAETALAAAGRRCTRVENPQVLQAAARADCDVPLVCFAGNPASAGWLLLRRLVEAGADVRYHGDFDWPGMSIAGRLIAAGAAPWRLTATGYSDAVADLEAGSRLALAGSPVATSWDPALAARMRRAGVAVHEESLLPVLLGDLRR